MTHLSLCSGIGGIDLAAEWAGFQTIGQCEIDEYASAVLAKNFKGVKNYGDIRTITADRLASDGIRDITVVSAGFPCQPYSLAGKGLGDGDERCLWDEVARVIREIRPKWFVGENTPGLFARDNQRYFQRVVSNLAEMGYSVSWGIWGASDVGAFHRRRRVFIVAYANGIGRNSLAESEQAKRRFGRLEIRELPGFEKIATHAETGPLFRLCRKIPYPSEPIQRNDDGISTGLDRLRCLGNAVVPQQIYPIFACIAQIEKEEENK